MITLENVSFKYFNSTKSILTNFSLSISKTEFIGIIGPTGSGKSTICYLLNGLIPHTVKGTFSGNVYIKKNNTRTERVEDLSLIVGYMLQEPAYQIATPTVESEIVFGMENMGFNREKMEEILQSVLKTLNLTHLRDRATSALSEGEKQRVILASILAMGTEILVLDECSSMLDTATKYNLASILKSLQKQQEKTIIVIDHDLDFLLELVDRVILINNGEIAADGKTSTILTDYELLIANGLTPPKIVNLFKKMNEKNMRVKHIPSSYEEAFKILKRWLNEARD